VQAVSTYCDTKDHHPEWSTANGGTLIKVKLTSHFAGNTVSLLDYELAEHMNKAFNDTQSTFNLYPMFDEKKMLSLCVGVGAFVFLYSAFNYYTGPPCATDLQRGKPLQYKGIVTKDKPVILVEEIEKFGLDAYVEKNLDAHGYAEHDIIRMPTSINPMSISSRYLK